MFSLRPDVYAISQMSATVCTSLSVSCTNTRWKMLQQGFASLWPLLSVLTLSTKSLVLFVVSSPWLVLNADVRDELLGYAADVRLTAVSCLQIHLGIYFFPPHSLSPSPSPSAEKRCKIKTNPSHNLTEDNVIPFSLWPLWVCAHLCV